MNMKRMKKKKKTMIHKLKKKSIYILYNLQEKHFFFFVCFILFFPNYIYFFLLNFHFFFIIYQFFFFFFHFMIFTFIFPIIYIKTQSIFTNIPKSPKNSTKYIGKKSILFFFSHIYYNFADIINYKNHI